MTSTKKPAQKSKDSTTNWYKVRLGAFFGLIVIFLLISLTAFWLQRTIFNTERFTATTTEALLQESSRQSIGSVVASKILAEQPTLKMFLGDKLAGQVSGLLGTEFAQNSIGRLAREAQLVVTSPVRKPLTFQLSSIKTAIVSVQGLASRAGQDVPGSITAQSIPDEVVIIDTSKIPNINKIAIMTGWIGPVAFILALVSLIWWIRRGGKKYRLRRIQIACTVVIITSLVAMAIGPLAEPAIIAVGQDASSQTLLSNVYNAFMKSFYHQAWWIAGMATLILAGVFVWERFLRHYSIKLVVAKKS